MKELFPAKLRLKPYKHEGSSGVIAYQTGVDFIILKFDNVTRDGKQIYLYNYEVPGKEHVETMKKLAQEGKGLTGYKNKYFMSDYYAYWDEKQKKFELKNDA